MNMRTFVVILVAIIFGLNAGCGSGPSGTGNRIDLGESTTPTTHVLVDFGPDAGQNTYGVEGWTGVIKSSLTDYITSDGVSGLALTASGNKLDNYEGVTGPELKLEAGDMIKVYWHNGSGQMVSLWRPLISFEDANEPVDAEGEPQWYAMKNADGGSSIDYVNAGKSMQSIYIITSEETAPGNAPPTEGWHSRINIAQNSPLSGIVCDKIEIIKAAKCKPSSPANLTAVLNAISPSSRVDLAWEASAGDPPVKYYKIMRSGLWVDKAYSTSYTDSHLEHSTEYSYEIVAVNSVGISGDPSQKAVITTAPFVSSRLTDPQNDLEYLGAFRFPTKDVTGGSNWDYRLGDLTYYPNGDGGASGSGASDGYPGSLFAYGHAHQRMVAEISIPKPVIATVYENLPEAVQLQPFKDVIPANDPGSYAVASPGIEYFSPSDIFYTIFGDNYNVSFNKIVSHGAFKMDPDLAHADIHGLWWIGSKTSLREPNYYSYAKFLFEIPEAWANAHTPGKRLISGASRAGGGPKGPGMVAIDTTSLPPPDGELAYKSLVHYDLNGGGPKSLNGWIENDSWNGGAWLEHSGKSSVVITGAKAYGEYYYGYIEGTVYKDVIDNVPANGPKIQVDSKGGCARSYRSMMIFYDPNDLAAVAGGSALPNAPQPYAAIDLDDYLLRKNTNGPDAGGMLGEAAYDREHRLLFVIENNVGTPSKDIVHVWKLK